jgi:hypothetical protein
MGCRGSEVQILSPRPTLAKDGQLFTLTVLLWSIGKIAGFPTRLKNSWIRQTQMATVWLTYAWEDNKSQDVDFIAQELVRYAVGVKLDRWNLGAGKRLWEQIESFIQDPKQSDAWALYATQASLGSQPCKEEFAYALDRALHARGAAFPVLGVFPGPVDNNLIPAGIKTRLYVSTRDPDWKERIKAAAEGRDANIARPVVAPYEIREHAGQAPGEVVAEVRPRAGTWAPFLAGFRMRSSKRSN